MKSEPGHSSSEKLAILAGKGDLPWIAARRAIAEGVDVTILYYVKNQPPPEDLKKRTVSVVLTKMFKSVYRELEKRNIRRLLLLGKATRDILYNRPSFDLQTLYILSKMKNTGDTTIFTAFAKEFEKRGVELVSQKTYLSDFFLPEGRYGKSCTSEELGDVEFGMVYAREMTRLDIGQTVVVGGRAVLAVEGAEGTDECIRRGGGLYRNGGAVVCKAGKKDHDPRFDLPTTGFDTLQAMSDSKCRVFVMDGANTLVLNPGLYVKEARKLGITILSVHPELADEQYLKKISRKERNVSSD